MRSRYIYFFNFAFHFCFRLLLEFLKAIYGEVIERARETEMVREIYMEMVETETAEERWRYRDEVLYTNR